MFTPDIYKETNPQALHPLIAEWPLAVLTVADDDGRVQAAHIPFLIEEGGSAGLGRLTGHLARRNPIWELADNREVLLVFNGPYSYVPVDAYANRKTFPTWSYGAIHARGRLTTFHDPEALYSHLGEAISNFDPPDVEWQLPESSDDMVAPRLLRIVGLQIDITEIEGRLRFGQDKKAPDRESLCSYMQEQMQREDISACTHRFARPEPEATR